MSRLILIFAFLVVWPASASRCLDWLKKFKQDAHFESDITTTTFSINYNKSILLNADVNSQGVVHYTIRSRDQKGQLISELFSAKEAYQAMLEHFGTRVKTIKTEWFSNDPTLMTNINDFNKALERGLNEEDAVWETWCGKRAWEAGYRKINFGNMFPSRESHNSTGNPYRQVSVFFSK